MADGGSREQESQESSGRLSLKRKLVEKLCSQSGSTHGHTVKKGEGQNRSYRLRRLCSQLAVVSFDNAFTTCF